MLLILPSAAQICPVPSVAFMGRTAAHRLAQAFVILISSNCDHLRVPQAIWLPGGGKDIGESGESCITARQWNASSEMLVNLLYI